MRTLIIDIEADNLLMAATQIWIVCALDAETGAKFEIRDAKTLQKLVDTYDRLVGHNALSYDFPVLNKLWGIKYDHDKIRDTLIISRLIRPDLAGGHSLKAWGQRLGFPKGDHSDFSKLSQEMIEYCHKDVQITHKLYKELNRQLFDLSGVRPKDCLRLEHDFANAMSHQVRSGFRLDKMGAEELYKGLLEEYKPLQEDILRLMPLVKDVTHYKGIEKQGNIISQTPTSYTYIQDKTRKVVTKDFKFDEPNAGSRKQLIDWFKSKGWRPKEFTEKGSPEINERILLEINSDESKKVARMFRLQKQMGMIKDGDGSWLNFYNEATGRVHGDINTNAANTGRATHSRPNIAQVDKKDLRMRALWVAPEGRTLVGTDVAGLELRTLGHYLHPYDKGAFSFECVSGDIHSYNQKLMGLNERNSAKTAIFALVYGAGAEKLGAIYAADQKIYGADQRKLQQYGSMLRRAVEDNFVGYKNLVNDLKDAFKQRGYLIGLDGRPLHPRSDYSALNLLIQSGGAIICKQWTVNIFNIANSSFQYGKDWELHGNIHDEVILSCIPEIADEFLNITREAIKMTQHQLKVKTDLSVDSRIGNNWKEVH